jgi:hypothetical protein
MPRYLVERTFYDGSTLPGPNRDEQAYLLFIENNNLEGVTWIDSFITSGGKRSYCIYEAPAPEALRRASQRNGLPVDRITEVQALKPQII